MKSLNTLIALVALLGLAATTDLAAQSIGDATSAKVSRGDADGSGTLDATDVKTMLGILFGGQKQSVSSRDLDVNRDGRFDIADVEALGRIIDGTSEGKKPAETRTERVVLGDANDDGKVDIADLSVLGQYLATGKHPQAPSEASDVNRDGKIDVADLSLLHLYL